MRIGANLPIQAVISYSLSDLMCQSVKLKSTYINIYCKLQQTI